MVIYNNFCTPEKVPADLKEVEDQLMQARNLCPLSMELMGCSYFFLDFSSVMCHNEKPLKAIPFQILNKLGQQLLWWYWEVESTLPQFVNLNACVDYLYSVTINAFKIILQKSPNYTLVFLPGVYEKLRRCLKQPRAKTINDPES